MNANFIGDIKNALFNNSTIFLNAAVSYLNRGIDANMSHKILSIVNTQMAVEAALKYYIISRFGIRTILNSKYSSLSDDDIEKDYYSNKLKIKEFDTIKNFLKSTHNDLRFDSTKHKYLERFQNYRNKIVHLNYSFSEQEDKSIESDVIFVIAHILGTLMGDGYEFGQRVFMQEHLYQEEYKN